ncbi:hypothetical protein HDU98_002349, partial [Podochytrium sp. JEL0797]
MAPSQRQLCFDSSDSDSSDDAVNCLCRVDTVTGRPMVQCFQCRDWLHCGCVGLAEAPPRWTCAPCLVDEVAEKAALETKAESALGFKRESQGGASAVSQLELSPLPFQDVYDAGDEADDDLATLADSLTSVNSPANMDFDLDPP